MAKERVTVCLPPCDRSEVLQAITAAMAPFDSNAPLPYPPGVEGEWDYWWVYSAGRPFRVLPGHENDPRILTDLTERVTGGEPLEPPFCDGGPRGILDFETPRAEAAAKAEERWRAWHEFAEKFPPARSWWTHFAPRYQADPGYSKEQALRDFENQPVMQAVRADPEFSDRFGFDPITYYGVALPDHVRAAALEVLPTEALLTLDGRWIRAHGREYREFFNDYLDRLPADAYVVRVSYHG